MSNIASLLAHKRAERLISAKVSEIARPGDPPEHEWDGTRLRFKHPDGTWGQWVDLRGPPGASGASYFGPSTGGADFDSLPDGVNTVPFDFVAVRQNGEWVRLNAQDFAYMILGYYKLFANTDAVFVNDDEVTL